MVVMDERQGRARRVADELRAAVVAERKAEAHKLKLVCDLADAYRSVVPLLEVPGGPRLVSGGADGTVDVDDFLIQELHPLLGVGPAAAWRLLRLAVNLRDRHPKAWKLVLDGVVPAWQGRVIAEDRQHLSRDAAAWVDEKIAVAVVTLAWPRVRRRLAGLIVQADTEAAADRIVKARRDRFVRIDHGPDGISWLTAQLATADAVRLGEAIGHLAHSLLSEPGYPGSPDEARAEALSILATPVADGAGGSRLPRPADAVLIVHLDQDDVAHPDSIAAVGRVEGPHGLDAIGPVLLNQVRELLAHRNVRVLPVLDLAGDPAVDAYEIPDRIRHHVILRDQYSVFPYATTRARACDLDHTIPWRADGPPGQTRPSRLGPLSRREHRAKTHGGWHTRQPRPGVFIWTSPLGYRYQVDHQGTHTLPNQPTRPPAPHANKLHLRR